MPDEGQKPAGSEPFLEVGTSESGGKNSAIFVITIILAILFSGFLLFDKYYTNSQAADRSKTLANLLAEINSKKNQEIESKAENVTSSLSILSTAKGSKYLFRAFIDELTAKITNDSKLNNLSIDSEGRVTMDGQSGSYRSVADLALALESSKKLKNVSISGMSQAEENGEIVVTFSMSAEISDWKGATERMTGSGEGGTSE